MLGLGEKGEGLFIYGTGRDFMKKGRDRAKSLLVREKGRSQMKGVISPGNGR